VTSTIVAAEAIGYDAAGFTGLRSLRRLISRKARRTHRYGIAAAGPSGFAAMKAAGADWVSLYIGGKYGVTSATIEAAWNAGLQVSPNYERAATLGLGGDTAGANAAVEARSELEALCFQGEATVFFSFVDFAATASQYPILDACVQGCLANWPDGWETPGMYGDGLWLNHLAEQPWWNGPLWYWAGRPTAIQPACTVKQRLAPTLDTSGFGVAVDEDVTIQPVRMWTGYGPDPLNPEDDVLTADDLTAISGIVTQQVFTVCLNLWREPEMHNIMQGAAQDALVTDQTKQLITSIVTSAVAALPPSATGLTPQQVTDACNAAIEAHIYAPLKQSS
jgi:hypothetical protein